MRSTRPTTKRRPTALPTRATTSGPKVIVDTSTHSTSTTTPPPGAAGTTSAVGGVDHLSLPYSAFNEVVISASHAHDFAIARRRNARGGRLGFLYRQLLRYVRFRAHGARSATGGPLLPGDVLRDFPYFTQASEISFFTTHPSLCDDIFTVGHGDRLRFGSGQWAGQAATVVGARGGQLWIVLDGESIARQLPAPESARAAQTASRWGSQSSHNGADHARGFWERVEAYYQVTRLVDATGAAGQGTNEDDATATAATGVSTDTAGAAPLEQGLSPRVLARVDEAARRFYSATQRAFLQRAPDLFVSVVADEEGSLAGGGGGGAGAVHSLSPFLPPRSGSGGGGDADSRSQSPFQGTPLRLSGGGDGASPGAEGHSPASARGDEEANGMALAAQRGALRAPLPMVVSGAEHGSSLYAMVANAGELVEGNVVLLAPRILAVSGTAGWAGEGTIVSEAGGIQHFKASLSASLVNS